MWLFRKGKQEKGKDGKQASEAPQSTAQGAPSQAEPDPAVLQKAHESAAARLVPLAFFAVLVAFMDRAALATTAPALVDALNLTDVEYGLASGIFYVGYVVMQYPSVLIVDLLGMRIWYGTIVVFWGLTTILTAFVKNATQLIAARFILGVAEAGVSILAYIHLDRFLPALTVTRIWSGYILIAVQLANIIMGPLSAIILYALNDSEGLQAYQWVYIIMGSLALVVGVAVYIFMVDSVEAATMLTEEQKAAIMQAKSIQGRSSETSQWQQTLAALKTWKSWYVGTAGLLYSAYVTMLQLYLPVLVLSILIDVPTLTSTDAEIYSVFLTTVPYIVGCLLLILLGESSSWLAHLRHPKLWVGVAAMLVTLVLTLTYTLEDNNRTVVAFIHLSIMSGLVISIQSPLDTLPSDYMQKEGVSKCYAVYTTLKNVGAAIGPIVMGFLLVGYTTDQALSLLGSAAMIPLVLMFGFFFFIIDVSGKPQLDDEGKKDDGASRDVKSPTKEANGGRSTSAAQKV